ncbi:MAG TPA: TonB-dependent receptor, partial [Saprospiraceae bacterium]|nr:TonB-dependent receptor [Saprospiraceae bacterium]
MQQFYSRCAALLVLWTLLSSSIFAQKGTVRGNVFDKETAQPVSFATVKVAGLSLGATTDINGFFSIGNVPLGAQKLEVSYTGYEPAVTDIVLKAGEIVFVNIYIQEGNRLEEVTVSGKKEQAKTEVQISKLSVTSKQIRALPSAGGQADIAQYLTVLPGVVFTGDQGGQLYIRGGSPVQNRILLDGMTIFNPFHSIGFYSVFETELIRNVDVLTGGFNADYGGRISAIVDVKTREGNRKRLSGLVSGSPFMAKALLEGPIIPLKEEGGGSLSVVFTGKKSLIDRTAQSLYSYVNDSVGIPFTFQDVYGKVSLLGGNGTKINFFGFKYDDQVKYQIADFSWNSGGGGMDFTLVPANSNTIVNGNLNYSSYDSRIEESDRKERRSGISSYYANLNFTNYGRNTEVKYGLELTGFRTDFTFVNNVGITLDQSSNTTEINSYARFKRKIGPLVLEPGIRVQYYQTLGEIVPEPRIGMKYNFSDRVRFKAAGGLYSQNLLSTINERDIVNLFVGFLSGPEEALYQPGSTTIQTKHRLQKSIHGVAGFEFDLFDNIDLNVEGYYKRFNQLISLNRNKRLLTDPNYFVETGDVKGVDVSLKWEGRRAYIWGAYSLGYVTRNDGEQTYPPVFDRRHNLNTVATYQLGKKREWELGARWNFGSGFPFTLTQGFYNNINFQDGINTDVYGGQGGIGILYADKRNGGRLPYYHRLDLSVAF